MGSFWSSSDRFDDRPQVKGDPKDFPKTKEQYVNWGEIDDDEEANRGSRFRKPLEPYTKPLK